MYCRTALFITIAFFASFCRLLRSCPWWWCPTPRINQYRTVQYRTVLLRCALVVQAAPIVRVAVEPQTVADLPALARGLRLLNRADPFVEVTLAATGEHVIAAAGEVHLERCIKDLQVRTVLSFMTVTYC